jgi:protein-tyrosine phosphatase
MPTPSPDAPRLYWIDAPFAGRLAVMPYPRIAGFEALRAAGVHTVVSLLEPVEAQSVGLDDESEQCRIAGMTFLSLPIVDHGIPHDTDAVMAVSVDIAKRLKLGEGVAIHCYAGLGRSPLLAAAVLIDSGFSVSKACAAISHARGTQIPETAIQRRWLSDYAARRKI